MNINDAKKVMLDRVNLDIEAVELLQDIHAKEKQIKYLAGEVREAEYCYNQLENSGIRKFFLGLVGKKENRLQELQNEVRRTKSELASAEFELASLKSKAEDIEQTQQEIDAVCKECLDLIGEIGGDVVKTQILAVREVPKLCFEITKKLAEVNPLFANAYNVYRVGEPTASCLDGNANNRSGAMRKHSKLVANGVDEIIQLLNTYNLYAPDEIKIEYHDKWMDKEGYWENQQMAEDSLDRIKKVEDWFYRLNNCWKGMGKQQKETMQKLQEEVLAYLDE